MKDCLIIVNLKKMNIACFKKNWDEEMKLHKQFIDDTITEVTAYYYGLSSPHSPQTQIDRFYAEARLNH